MCNTVQAAGSISPQRRVCLPFISQIKITTPKGTWVSTVFDWTEIDIFLSHHPWSEFSLRWVKNAPDRRHHFNTSYWQNSPSMTRIAFPILDQALNHEFTEGVGEPRDWQITIRYQNRGFLYFVYMNIIYTQLFLKASYFENINYIYIFLFFSHQRGVDRMN